MLMRADLTFFLIWFFLMIPLFFVFSWRVARVFYRVLGTWATIWTLLLMTWTVPFMVIAKVWPQAYHIIMRGITLGVYIVVSTIPIVGRSAAFFGVIVPLTLVITMYSLWFPIPAAIVIHRFLRKIES